MAVWSLNTKSTDPLVVMVESALSKSAHGKSREVWGTSGSRFPDVSIFYMAVWALNVKLAGPLVVTAGTALENYPWWTSRELQRTSGTRFRTLFLEPFQKRQVNLAPSDRRS